MQPTAFMLDSFTLPGDPGLIVHNMGDGDLVLAQPDESQDGDKWDRIAVSLEDLRRILVLFGELPATDTKNTDRATPADPIAA
jgi:hypothetical protein